MSKNKKVNPVLKKKAEFENELLRRGEIFGELGLHNIALEFTQCEFADTLKKIVLLAINRQDQPSKQAVLELVLSNTSILGVDVEGHSIQQHLRSLNIDRTKKFFEKDLHRDWFEEVWEITVPGSGPDLSALAAYGFTGYIYDTSHPFFLPWTFHDLFAWYGPGGKIPPREYIEKLIQNCERFLSSSNSLSDWFDLFNKALSFARARYELDFMEEVDANNFAIFSGRDIRTLANNGLLMPKESHKGLMILKKDAVNFLQNKKRPDGSLVKKDKAVKIKVGKYDQFPDSFYSSIWKAQIFYNTSIDLQWPNVELCLLSDFTRTKIEEPGATGSGIEKYERKVDIFPANVASHNKTRVKWIGSGKTFNEINAPNSKYRENIRRLSYKGNTSSIIQDLNYDLKKGWIIKVIK